MKKMIPKHIALLAALLLPLLLSARTVITHSLSYNYGANLTLGTDTLGGVTYSTVTYDGLYNGGDAGMPSLPVDYLKFSVPYDACDFSVTASASNILLTNISHMVYPCQPPRLMNDTTPLVIVPPDSAAYHASSGYPVQRAWVVDEGFLAGENHIVTVAVMPVAFRRTSTVNSLRQARNVTVRLSYERGGTTTYSPIVRNDSTLRAEGYELTRSMVVNPGSVSGNAPLSPTVMDSLAANPSGTGEGLNGWGDFTPVIIEDSTMIDPNPGEMHQATYPYLIITTPALFHSLRRLAALKRQKGYNVKVVTIDDVMADSYAAGGDRFPNGDGTYHVAYSDSAGVLRQFLKYHYINHGTKYVLLAGHGIPYRYTIMNTSSNVSYNKRITLPSDLYYCDLNCDWSIDTIDFTPEFTAELYVGRLIAKDEVQILNYTDKLLRYALNPGNGSYDYLKRAFYSEGYEMAKNHESTLIRSEMDRVFTLTTDQDVLSETDNGTRSPSGEEILSKINNNHYGYLSLNHHGFPAGLITYGYRNQQIVDSLRFLWAIDTVKIFKGSNAVGQDPTINNGLNNISNKSTPNICYSSACTSIPFDVITDYEAIPMNFGESFTTGKNYGGPCFIGNTREGMVSYGCNLEKFLGKSINMGYYHIGIANGLAKTYSYFGESLSRNYTAVVQNLLGDPELEIWTTTLQSFSNVSFGRGNNFVSIDGVVADSTIVAYCDNNGSSGFFTVSTSSCNLSGVSPNSSIMLYKHNYIPYFVPMALQNCRLNKSQYVITSDFTAGSSIDANRTPGEVIVKSGVEYEIEAIGDVRLEDGFRVEPGATFAVYPPSF